MKYSAQYHVFPLHFMLYRGKSIIFGTVWLICKDLIVWGWRKGKDGRVNSVSRGTIFRIIVVKEFYSMGYF